MQKIKPKVIHEYLPKFWNFMTEFAATHPFIISREEKKLEESPSKGHKKLHSEKIGGEKSKASALHSKGEIKSSVSKSSTQEKSEKATHSSISARFTST